MTYDARETGTATAQPVELYRWQHAAESYRYTSGQAAELLDSYSYLPAAIERGAIAQGDEIARAALEVTVPARHPVAHLFALGPPVDRVLLTIWRRHTGDPDAQAVVIWQGRVLSCEWSGVQAVLRHEPMLSSLQRSGLRRTWGLSCPHVLYGPACRLSAAAWRVVGTVASVSGASVGVAAAAGYADGHFAGGWLAREDGATGRTYRAMVIGHTGSALTLHIPLPLAAGDAVWMYPGCDRTMATCDGRFANILNFGGFPWTPKQSPYGGALVY